jgi:sortase A
MRAVRVAGNTFVVAGMTLLLFVVYEIAGTAAIAHRHQSVLARAFDSELRSGPARVSFAPANLRAPREGAAVARLVVPRLRMNLIVVEGVRMADLAEGPGHYKHSPLPGRPGAVAVAGHRTGWGSPFVNLDKLRAGDTIELRTTYGRFVYAVTHHRVVEPRDMWVLKGDPRSAARFKLTLTTCTPKFTSLHRLIVWADQVSPAAA